MFSVGLDYFFSASRDKPVVAVVRHKDRLRFPEKPGARDVTYEFESLDFPAVERRLNSYYVEFFRVPPDKVRLHQHAGGEFIYVFAGTLCVQVGDEEHKLEPRDSMYFDSATPHGYRSGGKKPARRSSSRRREQEMLEVAMRPATDSAGTLLAAWRTSSRVTAYLVEHLTPALWNATASGGTAADGPHDRRNLHNARCMWLKTLGREHGIAIPASVDRRTVEREELLAALVRSSAGIAALLELGIRAGGHVPPSKAYAWRNLPLDVPHVLTYFVATRLITEARSSWWRVNSVIDCRAMCLPVSGSGRSGHRNATLTVNR